MWIVICKSKKYRLTPEQKQNERWAPFLRIDMDGWSYLLTPVTHFFFWPRFLIGWSILGIAMIMTFVGSIGLKRGEKPGRCRTLFNCYMLKIAATSAMFSLGTFSFNKR
jgi:hypothetical protein